MDNKDRDPANMTLEERRETAAAEGLMATEEETDPEYTLEDDPSDAGVSPPRD